MLYRPNSDHERSVLEYATVFSKEHGTSLELISVESREGSHLSSLYEVMSFPSVVVTDDQGIVQQSWQGPQLPLMQELSYYLSKLR